MEARDSSVDPNVVKQAFNISDVVGKSADNSQVTYIRRPSTNLFPLFVDSSFIFLGTYRQCLSFWVNFMTPLI